MKKLFLNKIKQGKANVMFSLMTALAAVFIVLFILLFSGSSAGTVAVLAVLLGFTAILGFLSGYLFISVASMEEKERRDG